MRKQSSNLAQGGAFRLTSRWRLGAPGAVALMLAASCGGHVKDAPTSGAEGGAAGELGRAGSRPSFGAGGGRDADAGRDSEGGGGSQAGNLPAGQGGTSEVGGSPPLTGGAPPTVIHGPGGTIITVPDGDAPIELEDDCSQIPPGIFEARFEPCLRGKVAVSSTGQIEICYPNPDHVPAGIVRCDDPEEPARVCKRPEILFNGQCCALLPTPLQGGVSIRDPVCVWTDSFSTVAAGTLIDTDEDFVPNIADTCPLVTLSPPDNDYDGLGNICDNCPDVSNVDQVDTNGDGVGDACDPGLGGAGGTGGSP